MEANAEHEVGVALDGVAEGWVAVERKVALRARTHIEIDIMNTKHVDDQRIVSEDEQALAFLEEQASLYGMEPALAVNDSRVWRDFAHTLFNLKEFIHLV